MSTKGSIWNKWDFHIHTPASFYWNGEKFSKETSQELKIKNEELIKEFIETILNSEVNAFVIMDYWTFDGYIKIKKYIEEKNIDLKGKVIFPGIELRVEAPTKYRLNVHVILDPKSPLSMIDEFKNELKIQITNRALTEAGLIDFARRLSPGDLKTHGETKENIIICDKSSLKIGLETAQITKDSFKRALNTFGESVLVMMPWNTYGGLSKLNWKEHQADSFEYMNLSDIFEARGESEKDLINGKRTIENNKYFDDFLHAIGRGKLAVSGSDAHRFSDYGKYPKNKPTWLKCDLTFEGLKQACIEPVGRSYYGDVPPKLEAYRMNPGMFIDSIEIQKEAESDLDEDWFNSKLELNIGLVSIIGNKGSGKSALADIIGFSGNARIEEDYFSFLTDKRFKIGNGKLARNFVSRLTMNPGKEQEWVNLNDKISRSKFEYVKYIPQSYLEQLCNEVIHSRSSEFENELKKVIFSHIDQVERLGMNSFDELANLKIKQKNQEIEEKKSELKDNIKNLLDSFLKSHPNFKNDLIKKLNDKTESLIELDKNKPISVDNPLENSAEGTKDHKVWKIFKALQNRKIKIDKEIELLSKELELTTKKMFSIGKAIERLSFEKNRMDAIVSGVKEEMNELGISLEGKKIVASFEYSDLVDIYSLQTDEVANLKERIEGSGSESLRGQERLNNKRLERLTFYIDSKAQVYRESILRMDAWGKARKDLIGDVSVVDSIENLKARIDEAEHALDRFNEIFKNIEEISISILLDKIEIENIWKELYSSVQNFSNEHEIIKRIDMKIKFEANLTMDGFEESFLEFINQRAKGSFYSSGDNEFLKSNVDLLRAEMNVSNFKVFINEIGKGIFFDYRERGVNEMVGEKQLKRSKKIEDLLSYFFSLDYVDCTYGLRLGDRRIIELSPGEKGLLLLIFYILLDKQTIPLIIDQPEENLDNETIKEVLVPCILEAKERRQVIMVTHNPNLAVVCDSEQIIYSKIEKNNKNKITYITGGIENFEIRNKIVDILEGTMPAFKNRNTKYERVLRNKI